MKFVHYDHDCDAPSPPYREGEAGAVWIDAEGVSQTETRVRVSPNSLHALHGHGVVAQLAELELLVGPIAPARDAVIAPASLPEALKIFYAADRMTYGAQHDLLVARCGIAPGAVETVDAVEYRIVVDNREYQRTLSKLQFVCGGAGRMGHGLRLRL